MTTTKNIKMALSRDRNTWCLSLYFWPLLQEEMAKANPIFCYNCNWHHFPTKEAFESLYSLLSGTFYLFHVFDSIWYSTSSHSLASKNKIAEERPQKEVRPCKNHQSNVFGLFCEAEPMIPVFFLGWYLCFHLNKAIFHTNVYQSYNWWPNNLVQIAQTFT